MIRQLMTSGLPELGFSWQGGEPTLMGLDFFRRAVEYQKQFGRSGQVVANSLQTNGLLINDEWSKFFAEYHFLVGLSVDGPSEVHDRYRRTANDRESHKYALRAADSMRRCGVEFNILSVVNEHSARHAKQTYAFLREQGFDYMQFIPCIERNPQTNEPAPFAVSPEAYGDFLCALFDEWVRDFDNGLPTVSERTFDSLMHTYIGERSPMCIFMETCGDYVVVEHSGDVYSCDFYVDHDHHLGNLLDRGLQGLAASPRQIEFGNSKAARPPECETCPWLEHCFGGCLKDRYTIPGTHGSNYFCKAYQQFFAHSEPTFLALRERVLAHIAAEEEAIAPPRESQGQEPVAGHRAAVEGQRRAVGRNDPCPCGSGRKFKKCCMRLQSGRR
jgi:uncharacterized protein